MHGWSFVRSVTDRPTKAHEYIFLLSKSERYFYDAEAIKEDANPKYKTRYKSPFNSGDKEKSGQGRPGNASNTEGFKIYTGVRNKRTVWNISTKPFGEAHFAVFPPEIPETCIKAGCPECGTALDPFAGAGTTLWVAEQLGVDSIGIEINPDYCEIVRRRMDGIHPSSFEGGVI